MWGMRRIHFYSLKLGRHLNHKEEALRSVCVPKYVAEKDGAPPDQGFHFLTTATTGRTQQLHDYHHLILYFSLPVSLMFFFSFHLLITLWTQLTQIKEQLQSPGRKLELKGFSPSLLISQHFSSNSSGESSAIRGDVCLSPAIPSSPFLSLYLSKTVFRRALEPGISEKLLGSGAWEGLCPSPGLIRSGTLSRRESKATEKRSTFHFLLVFVMLSQKHNSSILCKPLTLPIFKYSM